MHPEFPPISFLAAAAVLIPLPAQWRVRNVAMLSLIAWLFMLNVILGVDAVVWADNVDIVIPVWCDITTKLQVGANIALPAAFLCICIHLEQISSTRVARCTSADRKRRQLFEVLMCVLLPLVYMGLHFIVQGHRFDIIQGHGCRSTTYFSIPSIFLISIPPLLLLLFSLVYGGLALRHFTAKRVNFASYTTQPTLTPSQFLRLVTMSILQMFWTIGVSIYVLWFNVMVAPLKPWTTWDKVHLNWLRIDLYAESSIPPAVLRAFYVIWWIIPVSTAIFVLFFAFGEESREIYASAAEWVWTKVFRQKKWGDRKNFKLKAFILK
ncbi:fungal pheromone STE3G-protein-coupled receptor [Marasmius fiardii PR-910]|nr:fungal pheromone STE3G-protein-coupled receptor [Marasmius fiardii PR-910]